MIKPLFEDDEKWEGPQQFYGNLITENTIDEDSPNFKEVLCLGIAEALLKRPESLWQLLYRMDISEKQVAMILESRSNVAEQIADLLIARVKKIKDLRSKF